MTHRHREHALTEIYGILLIVLLISVAVILIVGISGGFITSLLLKPPVFAVRVQVTTPYPGTSVISMYHMGGDPVALTGQSPPGTSSGVFFTVESPDRDKIAVNPSPVLSGNLWTNGRTATIYYDGSRFWVTDDLSTLLAKNGSGAIKDIPSGTWIVYITDQKTNVVVNSIAVTV